MGYVGGSIPGHTGTQQKHKKAFARRKQWAIGRPLADSEEEGNRRVVGKYELQNTGEELSNWIFLLLGILLIGAACWWGSAVTSNYNGSPRVIESKPDIFTKEQTRAYNFLVKSGDQSLALKDYRLAVSEFNLALEIAPYGKNARLGLVRALTLHCAEYREYCDKVDEQNTFIKQMGW